VTSNANRKNQGEGASRRPKFRLNPLRQAFFVGLAIAGIAIGYGLGFVMKKPPDVPVTPLPITKIQPDVAPEPLRVYEEPLHQDVIEPPDPESERELVPVRIITKSPPKSEPAPKPVPAPEPVPEPAPKPEASAAPETKPEHVPAPAPVVPAKIAAAMPKPAARKPKIAIVLDDLGLDKPRTARAIKLPGPLSLSFMSYASGLDKQTLSARAGGHELWLHIPMEPGSPDVDPGPNVLLTGLPESELLNSLEWNLGQFKGYVGVNNHMGSRFTADLPGVTVVMKEMKKRGLLFLDSVTSAKSVARKAARELGVPFRSRHIFLDHQDDAKKINFRLGEVERLARKTGLAIAIGHPREKTLLALKSWLDGIEAKGFQLIPLSMAFKSRKRRP